MATVRNASSGTIATKPTAFHTIADIRMACAASTAIKGSEAATKTSPMAKTEACREARCSPRWPTNGGLTGCQPAIIRRHKPTHELQKSMLNLNAMAARIAPIILSLAWVQSAHAQTATNLLVAQSSPIKDANRNAKLADTASITEDLIDLVLAGKSDQVAGKVAASAKYCRRCVRCSVTAPSTCSQAK